MKKDNLSHGSSRVSTDPQHTQNQPCTAAIAAAAMNRKQHTVHTGLHGLVLAHQHSKSARKGSEQKAGLRKLHRSPSNGLRCAQHTITQLLPARHQMQGLHKLHSLQSPAPLDRPRWSCQPAAAHPVPAAAKNQKYQSSATVHHSRHLPRLHSQQPGQARGSSTRRDNCPKLA